MTNMGDRRDISKSAPANGRRESTEPQKRSSTIKEINNWIVTTKDKGGLKRTGARNVSQLTENVTEERMLYARQLELGRERYKFLVSHEYEKQKFVERQTLKEKMMKKYMTSARRIIEKTHAAEKAKKTLTVRIPQVEYTSPTSTPVDRDENGSSRVDSRLSKSSQKRANGSIPRLKGMYMTQDDGKRSSSRQSGRPIRRAKEITFVDYSSRPAHFKGGAVQVNKQIRQTLNPVANVFLNTSANSEDEDSPKEGKLPSVANPCSKRTFQQERSIGGCKVSNSSRSSHSTNNRCPDRGQAHAETTSQSLPNAFVDPLTPKWKQKQESKFGEKFGSSITDPRYVALANTLSRVDTPIQPTVKVNDIIANNYVLRTSSRCESAAHAKLLHAKFIALLMEKELSMN